MLVFVQTRSNAHELENEGILVFAYHISALFGYLR
jgi:hypothetical protein